MLVPKLATTLRSYDRQQFAHDVLAGLIVGVVALPLCIAFAIASGATPQAGLYTGIVAGFLISALGGSRVQIGGPTGAFVVILYGIAAKYGMDGLGIATIMAGVILVIFGVARLGSTIKFIPHPVITGFTSGIAVIIFSGEIKDLLGIRMGAVPAPFLAKWAAFWAHRGDVSPEAVAVAAAALAIIIFWPRVPGIGRRLPAPFVALIVTTAAVQLLRLPVETIGDRFGALSIGFPTPTLPRVTVDRVTALFAPAFTIALLASIESLLSAVVADGMIGGRHRSNMELVAQGVANIASPLFGGIAATGAIARTATNVKNGGRTPIAGIVHAAALLLMTVVLGKWAALIPFATLAAILAVVAYHMSEWREFRMELTAPRSDIAVLLATFFLTVLVDLTVAIEVGMVLAAFLFIRRMSEVTNINAITRELEDDGDDRFLADPAGVRRVQVPAGVEIYEINGPFFFGAAERFKDTLARVANKPKVLIIRMRNVLSLDSTGMHALADVVHRTRGDGTVVLLSDVHMQPLTALTGSATLDEIGRENLFGTLDQALEHAATIVARPRAA